jgi:hypothetical protein
MNIFNTNRWKGGGGRYAKKFREMRLPLKILIILGGIALAGQFTFLFGLFVMLLWTWLMPNLFRLPRIDYWHAWGLVLLSHILFKSWGGRHWGRRRRMGPGRFRHDSDESEKEPAPDRPGVIHFFVDHTADDEVMATAGVQELGNI